MLDTAYIGYEFPSFTVPVEPGRLAFFSKAVGQPNGIFTDDAAAKEAGYRGVPIPPTFLFCLEMDAPDPQAMKKLLNIDIGKVLHGEQQFVYHGLAFAGDVLRFTPRIVDIYAKKNGTLEFVERETRVENSSGEPIADLRNVLVVRNG